MRFAAHFMAVSYGAIIARNHLILYVLHMITLNVCFQMCLGEAVLVKSLNCA